MEKQLQTQTEMASEEVVETKWKETVPPIIQELYSSMIDNQGRDIQAFHMWLRLLESNLTPNTRGLTVHYQTVSSKNDSYNLIRISFHANPDMASNRKTQIQILAFSLSSSSNRLDGNDDGGDAGQPTRKRETIPWDPFLEDLKNQHRIMHTKGQLDGDYDCFVAYKQYARLYTLRGAEHPSIRECWVRFGAEKMQSLGIQPLWSDPDDSGPLFEFKTHYTMIMHLVRAFAQNVNIPYAFRLRQRKSGTIT